jgi:hypothetical protein
MNWPKNSDMDKYYPAFLERRLQDIPKRKDLLQCLNIRRLILGDKFKPAPEPPK